MISVKQFMECIKYRITEGDTYGWQCYGVFAHFIQSETPEFSIGIVFDTVSQTVFEMDVWDYKKYRTYRWINPIYVTAVKAEYKQRGLKFSRCLDDRKYIDLDVPDDILGKATSIANGEEYDDRVIVEMDIPGDVLLVIAKAAHLKDITINQFMTAALEDFLDSNPKEHK